MQKCFSFVTQPWSISCPTGHLQGFWSQGGGCSTPGGLRAELAQVKLNHVAHIEHQKMVLLLLGLHRTESGCVCLALCWDELVQGCWLGAWRAHGSPRDNRRGNKSNAASMKHKLSNTVRGRLFA